jgi:hypothetical protein
MADPDAWTVVLSRSWDDGGALRDALVATVAAAPGDAARPALRNALVALGTGLEDGDPADWPFVEDRIEPVLPPLARALVQHVDVLTAPLAGAAAGTVDPVSVTAMRGLAIAVAVDERGDELPREPVGELIERALSRPRPGALGVPPGAALAAVSVPAAFVGVREYGARLLYAVEQHRRKHEAEAKASIWGGTFGIPFMLLGSAPVVGRVSGALERVVTRLLHTDGSWTNSPDRHEHNAAGDAVGGAATDLRPGTAARDMAAEEAVVAFAGAIEVLGEPEVPLAPDEPLLREVAEALVGDLAGGAVTRRLRLDPPIDGVVGEVLTSAW